MGNIFSRTALSLALLLGQSLHADGGHATGSPSDISTALCDAVGNLNTDEAPTGPVSEAKYFAVLHKELSAAAEKNKTLTMSSGHAEADLNSPLPPEVPASVIRKLIVTFVREDNLPAARTTLRFATQHLDWIAGAKNDDFPAEFAIEHHLFETYFSQPRFLANFIDPKGPLPTRNLPRKLAEFHDIIHGGATPKQTCRQCIDFLKQTTDRVLAVYVESRILPAAVQNLENTDRHDVLKEIDQLPASDTAALFRICAAFPVEFAQIDPQRAVAILRAGTDEGDASAFATIQQILSPTQFQEQLETLRLNGALSINFAPVGCKASEYSREPSKDVTNAIRQAVGKFTNGDIRYYENYPVALGKEIEAAARENKTITISNDPRLQVPWMGFDRLIQSFVYKGDFAAARTALRFAVQHFDCLSDIDMVETGGAYRAFPGFELDHHLLETYPDQKQFLAASMNSSKPLDRSGVPDELLAFRDLPGIGDDETAAEAARHCEKYIQFLETAKDRFLAAFIEECALPRESREAFTPESPIGKKQALQNLLTRINRVPPLEALNLYGMYIQFPKQLAEIDRDETLAVLRPGEIVGDPPAFEALQKVLAPTDFQAELDKLRITALHPESTWWASQYSRGKLERVTP